MISIGCDKAGTPFVERFCKELSQKGAEYKILFDGKEDGCDYTDAAFAVAKSVSSKESELGILICGTGIGMSMAANRNPKIRAALCTTVYFAELARRLKALGYEVASYTGFTWEQIVGIGNVHQIELLKNLDILVDGLYIEEKRNLDLRFRGSENQRIIDVQKSLEGISFGISPVHQPILCTQKRWTG